MGTKPFSSIILAAGKGTRMNTTLPKVLHPVAGLPMILRVVEAVKKAGPEEVRVVVGTGAALVKQVTENAGVVCFEQKTQLGTADAVRAAKPENLEGNILILNGDHPLITSEDVKGFLEEFTLGGFDLAVVTAKLKKPGSLGRIIRQGGAIRAIVEAKDASSDTLKVNEINTGIYVVKSSVLNAYLPKIKNNNAKKEFYLTDIIAMGLEAGAKVGTLEGKGHVALGVNDQEELSLANRLAYARKIKSLQANGVIVLAKSSTFIEEEVKVGSGTVLYPNVYLRGSTDIGNHCVIEPNCMITDSKIEKEVQVKANCYFEKCHIKTKAIVGPFARLRPGAEIGIDAHIGNFVEIKNTKVGDRAKASHLTYLGDAEIGEDTNIGCGTITCNYAIDKKKYKTKIGKNVFVGSDTQFVAPVEIGDEAVIASGSTITKNVPAGALAVARGKQFVKENYKPKKNTEG